jgi:hypothetical protein
LIFRDFGGQVNVNLYPLFRVLGFDSLEQTVEPFGRAKVSNDPDKVDLAQTGLFAMTKVVHSIPDRLEDGSEGCDPDTS